MSQTRQPGGLDGWWEIFGPWWSLFRGGRERLGVSLHGAFWTFLGCYLSAVDSQLEDRASMLFLML